MGADVAYRTAVALDKFREFLEAYDCQNVTPMHLDEWMSDNMAQEQFEEAARALGLDKPRQGPPYRRRLYRTWEHTEARLPLTTSRVLGLPYGTLSSAQLRQIPGLRLPKSSGAGPWQHYGSMETNTSARILHLRRRVLTQYIQAEPLI